mgnify:CR=1 FL=1
MHDNDDDLPIAPASVMHHYVWAPAYVSAIHPNGEVEYRAPPFSLQAHSSSTTTSSSFLPVADPTGMVHMARLFLSADEGEKEGETEGEKEGVVVVQQRTPRSCEWSPHEDDILEAALAEDRCFHRKTSWSAIQKRYFGDKSHHPRTVAMIRNRAIRKGLKKGVVPMMKEEGQLEADEATAESKKKYKCRRCGQKRQGHTCTFFFNVSSRPRA